MPTTKVESEIQGRKKKEIICKVFPSNEDSPQSKKEKKKDIRCKRGHFD